MKVTARSLASRLDELLDVLDALWTTNPVEHHGKHWSIPQSWVDLKPVQRPRPPIYLGAFTPRGLRRIGERADGWLAVVQTPAGVHHIGSLKRQRAMIDAAALAAGRDPAAIATNVRINVEAGSEVDQVAETIQTLTDTGYSDLFVDLKFVVSGVDAHLEWVQRLVDQVGPTVRRR
ncbi:LLM class flavin-dependent oxidoreductase [Nocardia sp. NPDC059180]|uniref:LLM class flavin-dependent oxidoreductase n=1 Tax=Nocardia sp. NPDC059180 TaxID=3346761 RepID=UPI0036A60EBD